MDERSGLLDPKERIKSLLENDQPLSSEDLDFIEGSLSKSEIKRFINSYPNAFRRFAFFKTRIYLSWPNKILTVLENIAIERLKKEAGFEEQISDDLLFQIVLPWTWSFNWFSKRSFCSPQNRMVRLAVDRIKQGLSIPGKARAAALARLENFPTELIKEVVSTDNFNLDKTDANHCKINAAWAEHTTPEFQALLNAKKVDEFTQRINAVNDVETIEKLMRQLIFRIKNSFFKSKYEAMLEACFIRVMELTPPQEVMKLDTFVVKEGLDVFQNYIFSSSRRNFFHKIVREDYTVLAYFRRRAPRLDHVPKFQALLQVYTIEEVSQFGDDKLAKEIRLGNVDIQRILQEAARYEDSAYKYKTLVERLLVQGANLEWMDVNFRYVEFSQFSFFVMAMMNHYKKAQWEFYVAHKNGDYTAILNVVIDAYIHFKVSPNINYRGISGFYPKYATVIGDILNENPNVLVTQKMLAKFDILDSVERLYDAGDVKKIKDMLRIRFAAQQVPVSSGKKDKGEKHLDISVEEAAVAVSALAARDAVEKRRTPSTEHVEQFASVTVPRPRTPPF